jgi:outer membrane murein-binding lipoprotein Lpp
MSEPNDNAEAKLERLLRRWGAEEAADRAPIGRAPHAPAAEPSPQPVARGSLLPWVGMLAVAAAAVVGFIILFGKLSGTADEVDRQSRRARQLQASVDDLERQLKSARQATTRSVQDVANQMDQLARDANEARVIAASLRASLAFADAESNQAALKLARSVDELAQWPRRLAAETARVTGALEEANVVKLRLSSAAGELDRVHRSEANALTATNAVRLELADLKARDVAAWNDFQQAYLAAAAPGETGLRAAQTAVRKTQLIERLGKVRAAADAPQRALLEKIEVLLTRLVMVEPSTFVSEDMFHSLLRTSGVLKQIDEAMASPTLAAPVRSIYFEARLILSGAERVG